MGASKIEWTEATWNPVTGCTKISPGCANCYAERMAKRLGGRFGYPADEPFRVTFHPDRLQEPYHWRKPRRVFVCSMGDLFHEDVTDGQILRVLSVALDLPLHTFLILTKRPRRMKAWFDRWADLEGEAPEPQLVRGPDETRKAHPSGRGQMFAEYLETLGEKPPPDCAWPTFDWMEGLRWWPTDPTLTWWNVWLGVTAEDQQRADERIPLLLDVPATVRFVSYEPALGPVDLRPWLQGWSVCEQCDWIGEDDGDPKHGPSYPCPRCGWDTRAVPMNEALDWVIAGGESGPKARPCCSTWLRDVISQCTDAGVPCFVKQLGARPYTAAGNPPMNHQPIELNHPKGADPAEWPESLRVREFPRTERTVS